MKRVLIVMNRRGTWFEVGKDGGRKKEGNRGRIIIKQISYSAWDMYQMFLNGDYEILRKILQQQQLRVLSIREKINKYIGRLNK